MVMTTEKASRLPLTSASICSQASNLPSGSSGPGQRTWISSGLIKVYLQVGADRMLSLPTWTGKQSPPFGFLRGGGRALSRPESPSRFDQPEPGDGDRVV